MASNIYIGLASDSNYSTSVSHQGQTEQQIQNFKNELNKFIIYKKKAEDIIEDFSASVPKRLFPQEIVNIIFQECLSHQDHKIPIFLNALCLIHPHFTLSPHDAIRKAILEDSDHHLNHDTFMQLLKEQGLENDEAKKTEYYELAYQSKHPFIHRPAFEKIAPDTYSLNFLWINLNPQDRTANVAKNIFGEGLNSKENSSLFKIANIVSRMETLEPTSNAEAQKNREELQATVGYRLCRWADASFGTQINLWYDSALVTKEAYQGTLKVMEGISQSRGVHLRLRDIRQLPNIPATIRQSLHPGTPVFYRVDIAKALIVDNAMSNPAEKAKYCVVSDLDIGVMSSEQLFDQRTLDFLKNDGYVFNRNGGLGHFPVNTENSFFIFSREKEGLQVAHRMTVIDNMVNRIDRLRNWDTPPDRIGWVLGSQAVFENYQDFSDNRQELMATAPRKVVKTPLSQFTDTTKFGLADHRNGTFRFVGDSGVPKSRNGRAYNSYGYEQQISSLKEWRAEPLQ